jgi:hypothetical protein
MKKGIYLASLLSFLLLVQFAFGQEKFIDVRQNMANRLTEVKTAVKNNDWAAARENFEKAKSIWGQDVKPIITEGVKTDSQFQEYFNRIAEVEDNLEAVSRAIDAQAAGDIEAKVNAAIWGISHHPRGFDLPKPRYSVWDWIFGLGIGVGFCLFATLFGLYLRKSYYRRYPKARFTKQ